MAGRFLLDTSIIVELFKGDLQVARALAEADDIFIPAIAIGELLYGAFRSAKPEANVQQVRDFAASTGVLPCDAGTAWEYGRVKDHLRGKGRPLPENDVWIAALAQQHDLILATRDMHFREVESLRTVPWTA